MQALHFVGFTADRQGLIFSARRGASETTYLVELDQALLDALLERAGQSAGEERAPATRSAAPQRAASSLSPREIQSRLRAGRTVAEVAAEAGVGEAWVERFAPPVLAEQANAVTSARAAHVVAPRRGRSSLPLAAAVARGLAERGLPAEAAELDANWNARHLHGGEWAITLAVRTRGRQLRAEWRFDTATRVLVAQGRTAIELGFAAPDDGAPGRRANDVVVLPGTGFVRTSEQPEVRVRRSRPTPRPGTVAGTAGTRAAPKVPRPPKAVAVDKAAARAAAQAERAAARRAAAAAAAVARREAAAQRAADRAAVAAAKAAEREEQRRAVAARKAAAREAAVERAAAQKAAAAARKAAARKAVAEKAVAKKAAAKKAVVEKPGSTSGRGARARKALGPAAPPLAQLPPAPAAELPPAPVEELPADAQPASARRKRAAAAHSGPPAERVIVAEAAGPAPAAPPPASAASLPAAPAPAGPVPAAPAASGPGSGRTAPSARVQAALALADARLNGAGGNGSTPRFTPLAPAGPPASVNGHVTPVPPSPAPTAGHHEATGSREATPAAAAGPGDDTPAAGPGRLRLTRRRADGAGEG
ncbi:MAG TPA: septation protein SepH [Acidimicrobiales bacterium]|nr:septation protein SepH [Acidimicrobiales bacterium]